MPLRHAAQGLDGVLKAFGEGHEGLAAKYDVDVLKTRERQPEVIDAVCERHPRS